MKKIITIILACICLFANSQEKGTISIKNLKLGGYIKGDSVINLNPDVIVTQDLTNGKTTYTRKTNVTTRTFDAIVDSLEKKIFDSLRSTIVIQDTSVWGIDTCYYDVATQNWVCTADTVVFNNIKLGNESVVLSYSNDTLLINGVSFYDYQLLEDIGSNKISPKNNKSIQSDTNYIGAKALYQYNTGIRFNNIFFTETESQVGRDLTLNGTGTTILNSAASEFRLNCQSNIVMRLNPTLLTVFTDLYGTGTYGYKLNNRTTQGLIVYGCNNVNSGNGISFPSDTSISVEIQSGKQILVTPDTIFNKTNVKIDSKLIVQGDISNDLGDFIINDNLDLNGNLAIGGTEIQLNDQFAIGTDGETDDTLTIGGTYWQKFKIGNDNPIEIQFTNRVVMDSVLMQRQYTGSLTDGTPTSSEITSIFGLSPSTIKSGTKFTIKDSDGTELLYIIESDGTDWFYVVTTKAL